MNLSGNASSRASRIAVTKLSSPILFLQWTFTTYAYNQCGLNVYKWFKILSLDSSCLPCLFLHDYCIGYQANSTYSRWREPLRVCISHFRPRSISCFPVLLLCLGAQPHWMCPTSMAVWVHYIYILVTGATLTSPLRNGCSITSQFMPAYGQGPAPAPIMKHLSSPTSFGMVFRS